MVGEQSSDRDLIDVDHKPHLAVALPFAEAARALRGAAGGGHSLGRLRQQRAHLIAPYIPTVARLAGKHFQLRDMRKQPLDMFGKNVGLLAVTATRSFNKAGELVAWPRGWHIAATTDQQMLNDAAHPIAG